MEGNPVLISMATQPTAGATNVWYNCSEFFYDINVPSNRFFSGLY